MAKISIIGAGSVGSTAAFLMSLKNLGDIVLFDIVENLPQGKALDILHCAAIENFKHSVTGTNSYSDIAQSDLIVITAGFPRKGNKSRTDLLMVNFEIVRSVAVQISKYAPNALIIVVTNPADVMTWVAKEFSGVKPNKIIGMGGVLDSSRFSYYLSTSSGTPLSKEFVPTVVGNHGEHMVGSKRSLPNNLQLSNAEINIAMEQTRRAGQTILELTKTSSCFAPASAITLMAEAYIKNKPSIMPCSAYLTGQYGIKGICIGVPVMIDRNGVEPMLNMELDEEEKKIFYEGVRETQASIDMLMQKIAAEDVGKKPQHNHT
jgi:malate dehydrogenase